MFHRTITSGRQPFCSADNDEGLFARPQEEDFLFFANAGKHISILLWKRLFLKGQSKIEKSLPPPHQEKTTEKQEYDYFCN